MLDLPTGTRKARPCGLALRISCTVASRTAPLAPLQHADYHIQYYHR